MFERRIWTYDSPVEVFQRHNKLNMALTMASMAFMGSETRGSPKITEVPAPFFHMGTGLKGQAERWTMEDAGNLVIHEIIDLVGDVGGWATCFKHMNNMSSSVGMMKFPIYGKQTY